jgi:hypothetical protein
MSIPLMGDPIYKSGSASTATTPNEPLPSRLMLHASGIHIPCFLHEEEPINIWCPPPFSTLADDSPTTGLSDDDLENCSCMVKKLMAKHCDVPGMLQTMIAHSEKRNESDL